MRFQCNIYRGFCLIILWLADYYNFCDINHGNQLKNRNITSYLTHDLKGNVQQTD